MGGGEGGREGGEEREGGKKVYKLCMNSLTKGLKV